MSDYQKDKDDDKRDMFALVAMHAILTNSDMIEGIAEQCEKDHSLNSDDVTAQAAYSIADAMVRRRDIKPGKK